MDLMEDMESGANDVELIIGAAILLSGGGKVVHVTVDARVLGVRGFIRDGVETRGVDHAARDATAKFLNLFADVKQEGVRAPAT